MVCGTWNLITHVFAQFLRHRLQDLRRVDVDLGWPACGSRDQQVVGNRQPQITEKLLAFSTAATTATSQHEQRQHTRDDAAAWDAQ